MSPRATPEEAADRIHSAAIHLLRRVSRVDAESGLSAARLSALSVVVFAGPLPLGELAAAEGVKPPTMSGIVDGLVRDGLVRRDPSPDDGRRVRVRATPKGRRLLQAARRRRLAVLAEQLRTLDGRQVATVKEAAELLESLPWR